METNLSACAGLIASFALLWPSRPCLAAPPPPPPDIPISTSESAPTVAVFFDGGPLPPELAGRIERGLISELENRRALRGVELVGHGSAASHSLQVRVVSLNSDARDYEVELTLLGGSTRTTLPRSTCPACNERHLIEHLAEVAIELHAAHEERAPSAEGTDCPESTPAPAVSAAPKPRSKFRLGGYGYAGIVFMSMGVAGSAAGAYFLGRSTELHAASYEAEGSIPLTSDLTLGAPMLAAGVAAITGGTALFVVGLRRGLASRNGRAQLTPQLAPGYVGGQLHLRF